MLTLLPPNCLTVLGVRSYLIVDLLPGSILYPSVWRPRAAWAVFTLSHFHPLFLCHVCLIPGSGLLSYCISLAFILFNLLKIHFCHLPQRRPKPNLLLRLLSVMLSDFMFLLLQVQLGFNLVWSLWIGHHRTHITHNKWEDVYVFSFFSNNSCTSITVCSEANEKH